MVDSLQNCMLFGLNQSTGSHLNGINPVYHSITIYVDDWKPFITKTLISSASIRMQTLVCGPLLRLLKEFASIIHAK